VSHGTGVHEDVVRRLESHQSVKLAPKDIEGELELELTGQFSPVPDEAIPADRVSDQCEGRIELGRRARLGTGGEDRQRAVKLFRWHDQAPTDSKTLEGQVARG
jgi:hypothetical protein